MVLDFFSTCAIMSRHTHYSNATQVAAPYSMKLKTVMKNHITIVSVIAVTFFLSSSGKTDTVSVVPVTANAPGQEYLIKVPDYSTISENDLLQATNDFVAQNDVVARNLLMQYRSNKLSNAQKSEMIFLLGEMQVDGAVEDLINDIGFIDKHPLGYTPQIRGGYAAQKALASIGKFSFDEIMEVMSDHKKNVPFVVANADSYAWVLWAIEGKHCTIFRLQDRMASEKNPKVRSQYMMVVKQVSASHNEK